MDPTLKALRDFQEFYAANTPGRSEAALETLLPSQKTDLIAALGMVRAQLAPEPPRPITLRTFRAGDMGMIVARQSILYAESQGWGSGLEINEAQTAITFLQNFKPGREQCWIAEQDGAMAGSVILTDEGSDLSRLRLLYVEPFARRRGLGETLVKTCLSFARETGYAAMTLWTHSILESARRIYAAHGFEITATETHSHFGHPVQGENLAPVPALNLTEIKLRRARLFEKKAPKTSTILAAPDRRMTRGR